MRQRFQPEGGEVARGELARDLVRVLVRIGSLDQHGLVVEGFEFAAVGRGQARGLQESPALIQPLVPPGGPLGLRGVEFRNGGINLRLALVDSAL